MPSSGSMMASSFEISTTRVETHSRWCLVAEPELGRVQRDDNSNACKVEGLCSPHDNIANSDGDPSKHHASHEPVGVLKELACIEQPTDRRCVINCIVSMIACHSFGERSLWKDHRNPSERSEDGGVNVVSTG